MSQSIETSKHSSYPLYCFKTVFCLLPSFFVLVYKSVWKIIYRTDSGLINQKKNSAFRIHWVSLLVLSYVSLILYYLCSSYQTFQSSCPYLEHKNLPWLGLSRSRPKRVTHDISQSNMAQGKVYAQLYFFTELSSEPLIILVQYKILLYINYLNFQVSISRVFFLILLK